MKYHPKGGVDGQTDGFQIGGGGGFFGHNDYTVHMSVCCLHH